MNNLSWCGEIIFFLVRAPTIFLANFLADYNLRMRVCTLLYVSVFRDEDRKFLKEQYSDFPRGDTQLFYCPISAANSSLLWVLRVL